MDLNKKVLIGIIVLIVLLLVFNVRISYLKEKFDKYCINQYDPNDSCPCMSKKQVNFSFSNFNETKYLNSS